MGFDWKPAAMPGQAPKPAETEPQQPPPPAPAPGIPDFAIPSAPLPSAPSRPQQSPAPVAPKAAAPPGPTPAAPAGPPPSPAPAETPLARDAAAAFASAAFNQPFRKYQSQIFDKLGAGADRQLHIVAPPGAGKTIVGLELLRRFGRPAVVFAPTSTIQDQWKEKFGFFVEAGRLDDLCSTDAKRLAPINIYTYQLIATPGQAQDSIKQMARQHWIDELVKAAQVTDAAAAEDRLATLEKNNPDAYRQEVSARVLGVRKSVLHQQGADASQFLHPNAQALISALATAGVGTVVLDECHHLLDYWAIVLRLLIGRLGDPTVIGLTATLPDPEDPIAFENYTSLLGDVDYEVPTPAVIKEGELAPYQDLVYCVSPSERELAYLKDVQQTFEAAVDEVTGRPEFLAWVREACFGALPETGAAATWGSLLKGNATLAIAMMRFLRRAASAPAAGVSPPTEAQTDVGISDWLALLERYGLDVLKVSADGEDQKRMERLRDVLHPFGYTLTETGMRQARSATDLVLTFSEAKDDAVAYIVESEAQKMADKLRAVVVTDFEHDRSGLPELGGVQDQDAGSARRLFRHLVSHPMCSKLNPALVTGQVLWVSAEFGSSLIDALNDRLGVARLDARCTGSKTPYPNVVEVVGEGKDWSSRTYVHLVTTAFEAGLTQCLVGTRGIMGEGWDAMSLNTLIDLTSVTTSTAVQQLRGRSMRKDPNWDRKLSNNWDVIAVAPEFDRGDTDLARFITRHERFWGTTPSGEVVKGVAHVDPDLAAAVTAGDFRQVDYGHFNTRLVARIAERDKAYDLWGVGQSYNGTSQDAVRVKADDLHMRTMASVTANLRSFTILGDQPPAAALLDMATAVQRALVAAGLVNAGAPGQIQATPQPDGSYEINLNGASADDVATFMQSYGELFEPLRDQRFLILYSDKRLGSGGLMQAAWTVSRAASGGGSQEMYFPVPRALGTNKQRAAIFAHHWAENVGGGSLVAVKSGDAGWQMMMQAQAQARVQVERMNYEVWR